MTTTAKIGAFFLIVLVVTAILIMRIEDLHFGKNARTATAEVQFKDVAGLDDKSSVRIAGVRVGKIDGIKLLPDGTAVAKIALDKDVELREGAFGQIRSLGMLGDKYVELYPGRADGAKLPEGVRLAGGAPTGLDDLTKLAGEIGKDVKSLTGALANTLGGKTGEEKINRIVDNIGRVADALRAMVETNRGNVDVTMANLKEFSSDIRETLARVDRILAENRGGVKGSVSNIEEVTAKLKTTTDNLNSITTKIDSGKGTIGKLLNDDETHKNLNEALQSVKAGVESLSSTLAKANKIQLDLGFRGEYLAASHNTKSYFTLDVIPRENKFYRIEVSALPGGKRKDTFITTTTTLADGTQSVVHQDIQTFEDEFAFSLQLGYRMKNTVLRAGLIESRGGLAIDQMLFTDRVQLSAEGWDFGRKDAQGHLKVYGRYNANPNLYVTGGVDDPLNNPGRSLFLGAGLRWKDEDIKTLLGAASFLK